MNMVPRKVFEDPGSKRALNKKLFSIVAPRYMLITRGLSFFRDNAWKKCLVGALPRLEKNDIVVDVACGTGDIARLIAQNNPDVRLIGCDLTLAMLTLAKQGFSSNNISFSCHDMNALGLKPGIAACITGGYALRNAPELKGALAQFHDLLKENGCAAFLDFSKSSHAPIAFAQVALLSLWGGLWGLMVHGKPWVYGYLGDSLKQYPNRNSLHELFKETGFTLVFSRLFMLGLIELTVIKKMVKKNNDF